jgi:hypothetical protein
MLGRGEAAMTIRKLVAAAAAAALSCSSGGGGGGADQPPRNGIEPGAGVEYALLAWNDLGMHCLNPTYDQAVILPPHNTLWAQVVRRGGTTAADRPQIVTAGVTVEYRVVNNTSSADKARYGEFWQYAEQLFGRPLAPDTGLFGAGLSGTMSAAPAAAPDHFEAVGVPVVPVDDAGAWSPYQLAEVVAKEDASGRVIGSIRVTIPTSDEIRCDLCHGPNPTRADVPLCGGATKGPDALANVIAKHNCEAAGEPGRTIAATPVLCASCHASPALGTPKQAGIPYLSAAIHGAHGELDPGRRPGCYDCHPGPRTQCNRSLAHAGVDGECTKCHGTLAAMAAEIAAGRIPWQQEPACTKCHPAVIPEVDTGATLYRNARGHGGKVYCAGCHGSPHTMMPSRVASDDAIGLTYQGLPLPLGDCYGCHHPTSGGGSVAGFDEPHGGATPEHRTNCMVCHTSVSAADTTRWPHGYGWTPRTISF